jgi:hypothetical protein
MIEKPPFAQGVSFMTFQHTLAMTPARMGRKKGVSDEVRHLFQYRIVRWHVASAAS